MTEAGEDGTDVTVHEIRLRCTEELGQSVVISGTSAEVEEGVISALNKVVSLNSHMAAVYVGISDEWCQTIIIAKVAWTDAFRARGATYNVPPR